MEAAVTVVRVYIPEMTHSTRKAQLQKILSLLCDQIHIHGVMVVPCIRSAAESHDLHYETVGDVLRRNPDPPLIVEFFDEEAHATDIRKRLHNLAPGSHTVYWDASWERASPAHTSTAAPAKARA